MPLGNGLLLTDHHGNLISLMGILPNCSRVSTITWLHHLDSIKNLREKAR